MARAAALLLFALLCCGAFAQDFCDLSIKCVGEGDSCANAANCGQSGQDACVFCKDTACVSNVCVAGADKGETCAANGPVCSHDKYFGLATVCVNGKCGTNASPLYPGDTCSNDDPLIENADTNGGCFGTTCVSGKCDSTPSGGNCSLTDPPCAQGQICSSLINATAPGVCQAWLGKGQSCTVTAVCAPNLVCTSPTSSADKVCTELFSVASGAYCDPTIFGAVGEDGDSGASLVCQKGLTCTGGTSPTCQDPDDSPIGKSCDTVADCGSSSLYACREVLCEDKNICVPTYIRSDDKVASDYASYLNCLADNNCASTTVWSSGTGGGSNCAFDNCFSEWEKYRDDLPYSFGECGNSAASLIPLAVFALVAVLFLLF